MSHQLEQLLTCCICLDRFRNPKLLPCQHSVCMEPCMEGLVDYVRRQVKCPECRAEHRIPYNGVQGFPSNVTLQRFLEAQIEITGEIPDPHTGQFMERCAVCNEKDYLAVCAHCEKKICEGCKAAHSDVLKREIGRINNQVKRAAHRLDEQLQNVERQITSLKGNTNGINEEIENISKRLQKAVRDRATYLTQEVQNQYNAEMRSMQMLKSGLETEISNVHSNIGVAEKHMDDDTPWDDSELMDTKDIFLKTMEFIRSFDYDTGGEYARKTRFNPPDDLNKLASTLSNMGELTIPSKHNDPFAMAQSFGSSGLAKSKSDHRLAVQFRDQEESSYGGRTSPVTRRRFGERPPPVESHDSAYESDTSRRRFRSRFMKKDEDEDKGVRFNEEETTKSQRTKIIDTEDASRGPLSGVVRILDSPRVIQRLQERDLNAKKKKEEASKPPTPKPAAAAAAAAPVNPFLQKKAARQISEDEIDKIKKQNKNEETASSSSGATATPAAASSPSSYGSSTTATPKPSYERSSNLREDDRTSRTDYTSHSPRSSVPQSPPTTYDDDTSTSSRRRDRDYTSTRTTDYTTAGSANGTSSRTPSRKTSVDTGVQSVAQRSQTFSRSSSTSSIGESTSKVGGSRSSRALDTASIERRLSRSNSIESNKSYDGTTSPRKAATGAAFSTDELRNRFGRTTDSTSRTNTYPRTSTTTKPTTTTTTTTTPASGSRFQSRFLGRAGTPSVEASKESGNEDDDEESSEESDSDDSEESSEEEEEEKSTHSRSGGGLLGRSTQNPSSSVSSSIRNKSTTDSGYGSRYGSSNDNSSSSTSHRYGTSTDTSSTPSYRRPSLADNKKDEESKYSIASKYSNRNRCAVPEEEAKPAFQSRFLNRSKSSAILAPDNDKSTKDDDSTIGVGSSRARFEELKERRQRIARSKSSAGLDDDDATTADSGSSASTYKSKYSRDNDTGTSSSAASRALGTSTSSTRGDDGGSSTAQLSNWARYLKNKYGNKSGNDTTASGGGSSGSGASSSLLNRTGVSSTGSSGIGNSSSRSSTASALARSRSSHLLGIPKDGESSEDDSSKNVDATPTFPAAATGTLVVPTPIGSIHRNQYLKKQHLLLQIGSRGSEPGNFTWPRGVAVGPDNSIVVADSSNHRVQVFDQNGRFIKEFGSYGSEQGEFDCLAGVAVNRIGQYIIADRYNHRIQIFDPSGMFLRSFGSQGSGDGRFSYPWGVTTDALGFIYVCDKENHRVQVFQSDGTFVGKFGSLGNKPGQLEHPHYIAVSSTNRVIVSDSNNHRIQIFDINGKVQTTFGGEGAEEGQFKFPRGVAVDEQGFIIVADSGNNRIQLFQADGSFLRAFGCWGSMDGEFKGLEGVAVMPNGNILVCDRENHRVQIF